MSDGHDLRWADHLGRHYCRNCGAEPRPFREPCTEASPEMKWAIERAKAALRNIETPVRKFNLRRLSEPS